MSILTDGRMGVLADDLTGAHATGARLRANQRRPVVVWHVDQLDAVPGDVVVDMRTRDRADDPAGLTRSWTHELLARGFTQLELRVDTTLRGAGAEELGGMLSAVGGDPLVIAVPAHPDAGRTTVDGIQRVDDNSGRYSIDGTMERLFGSVAAEKVPLAVVKQGPEFLMNQLREMWDAGVRRVLIDADQDFHLRIAAESVELLRPHVESLLTVSSGAWLSHHPWTPRRGVVLGVVASPTPANGRQVETLRGHHGVTVLACDARKPIERLHIADEIRAATWAVVLDTSTTRDEGQETAAWSASAARATRSVADILGTLGNTCIGFVVTGGEAAGHLVEELSAAALVPEREVEPLCPLGRLVGGPWDGVPLVTKGGVIGNPRTFLHLIEVAHAESSSLQAGSSPAKERHV